MILQDYSHLKYEKRLLFMRAGLIAFDFFKPMAILKRLRSNSFLLPVLWRKKLMGF